MKLEEQVREMADRILSGDTSIDVTDIVKLIIYSDEYRDAYDKRKVVIDESR